MVARGYVQKDGIYHDKKLALDVLVELLLVIGGKHVVFNWHFHHADILTATLNDDIDVELYVIWDGVSYKLIESLYSLKQSPRLWYEKLEER